MRDRLRQHDVTAPVKAVEAAGQGGSLMVRQVTRYRVQFAVMAPEYIAHYVPDYVLNSSDRFIGHAKVELIGWIDRDAGWL